MGKRLVGVSYGYHGIGCSGFLNGIPIHIDTLCVC